MGTLLVLEGTSACSVDVYVCMCWELADLGSKKQHLDCDCLLANGFLHALGMLGYSCTIVETFLHGNCFHSCLVMNWAHRCAMGTNTALARSLLLVKGLVVVGGGCGML